MQELSGIISDAELAIKEALDLQSLDAVRVNYLGKKGQLTDLLKSLGQLSADERPKMGQAVNQAKRQVAELIAHRKESLTQARIAEQLKQETIDVTLPGRHHQMGSPHPVSRAARHIIEYFTQLGFEVVEGPEVETDYYNFQALNIPEHHPARAMADTFYFGDGRLLRTHTSPVQIRTMENRQPPLRLIAPGRVYRCDSDVTHTPMFNQVEGLYVAEHTTLAELKGILHRFFNYYFGKELELRFRPSYFPFTEPSAEVDIQCTQCEGDGCRICSESGWLEVLGCGMVHPNVLKAVNIDSEKYVGWAFGMGIDRMAMLRYGINDLRMLFENDLRLLEQF